MWRVFFAGIAFIKFVRSQYLTDFGRLLLRQVLHNERNIKFGKIKNNSIRVVGTSVQDKKITRKNSSVTVPLSRLCSVEKNLQVVYKYL